MYSKHHLVLLLALSMIVFAACQSNDDATRDPDGDVSSPTPVEVTPTSEDVVPTLSTPIRTFIPDTLTPDVFTPFPTEANFISPTPSSREYGFIVHYSVVYDNADDISPLPPEDVRWIVINATIINTAGNLVALTVDAISLLDADGNQYPASEPNELTTPALIGLSLAEGEAEVGFVMFEIPVGIEPVQLIWCPQDDCSPPIYSEVAILD